jgi:hypothetical protein
MWGLLQPAGELQLAGSSEGKWPEDAMDVFILFGGANGPC